MPVPIPWEASAAIFWQMRVNPMPTTAMAASSAPYRRTADGSRAPTPSSIIRAMTRGVSRSKNTSMGKASFTLYVSRPRESFRRE